MSEGIDRSINDNRVKDKQLVGGKLNKEEEKYSHLTLQAKDKLDRPFMVFRK
jgi:hypothetical protein